MCVMTAGHRHVKRLTTFILHVWMNVEGICAQLVWVIGTWYDYHMYFLRMNEHFTHSHHMEWLWRVLCMNEHSIHSHATCSFTFMRNAHQCSFTSMLIHMKAHPLEWAFRRLTYSHKGCSFIKRYAHEVMRNAHFTLMTDAYQCSFTLMSIPHTH